MKKKIIVVSLLIFIILILIVCITDRYILYRSSSNKYLNQDELKQLCYIYEKLINSKSVEERRPYLTKEFYEEEIKGQKLVEDTNKDFTYSFKDLHCSSKLNMEKAYYYKIGDEIFFYPNPKVHRILWLFIQFPTGSFLIFVLKDGRYYYSGKRGNMMSVL